MKLTVRRAVLVWQVLLQWHNFNAETAMSGFDNPYDPETELSGCSCGAHASQAAHDEIAAGNDVETLSARFVESSLVDRKSTRLNSSH